MKIAINGAGIAGPTLAYWLLHHGHEPVLIEQAPRLREGGYIIDFWGTGYDVADKMGLVPHLRDIGYAVGQWRLVDQRGHRIAAVDTSVFDRALKGRITSLQRSELAAAIHGAIEGRVETLFSNSIAGIEERGSGVRVSLDRGAPRDFDLVVGADGLHSRVRDLAFAASEVEEHFLGYHVAACEIQGYRPRDELVYVTYSQPGRMVSRFSLRDDRTLFLFVFHDDWLRDKRPADASARTAALRRVYADAGWETPQVLAALGDVEEIYFDRVSQIRMPRWSTGRTALIGDAAACVSLLAGEGTGLAMTAAYVLAGELHRARGDHAAAFAQYEMRMRPFLEGKQKSAANFAGAFAPRTGYGLAFRNAVARLLRFPVLADWFVGSNLRDDLALPDYS